jgi:hypothetical protein
MSTTKRSLRFESVDELLAEVERLRQAGYTKLGEWELPQMMDHIARQMTLLLEPGGPRVPWALQWIARRVIHRMAVRKKYLPFKARAAEQLKPSPDATDASAYASLVAAVDRLRSLKGDLIDTHTFGTMSRHDYIQMQLVHAAHHLGFLIPNR